MQPKVTVGIITYNHEKFIRQAIEGVLIQTYDNYEIIISDDNSTDRTIEIINEYKHFYPDKIKVLKNKENLGASKNFRKLYQQCDGDYVAMLDGDDYWIDPNKLQIQVDFLEKNKDYVMSFHQARVLRLGTEAKFAEFIPPNHIIQRNFTIEDVMNDLFVPTTSVVFRNGNWNEIPQWFEELIVCDKPLHLMNLMHGKIKYFHKCMSVYRVHENGIWSANRLNRLVELDENKIKMLNFFNEYSKYRYNEMIQYAINRCKLRIFMNRIKYSNIVEEEYKNNQEYQLIYEKINSFLESKKVYIFGTGEAGKNSYNLMMYANIPVTAFLDNDQGKQGFNLYELPILSPEKIKKMKNIYIIVGSMYYDEIKEQLIEYGFKEKNDFTKYTDLLSTIDLLNKQGVYQ